MLKPKKRMDIKEFREFGLLHEVNRLFFHPLGLALEVEIDEETDKESLGGIWDSRDDSEGILLNAIDDDKVARVAEFMKEHHAIRESLLGYIIQTESLPPKVDKE